MIKILNYKELNKNSLKGSIDIECAGFADFQIFGISIFDNGKNRWLSFPSRKMEVNGEKPIYLPYCRFKEPKINEAFQKKVLATLDEYLKSEEYQQSLKSSAKNENKDEETPF